MKKILLLIIFIGLIISCNTKKNLLEKEKLYGHWYLIDNPDVMFEFTKDSLIVTSILPTLHNWKISNDEIILSNSTTRNHELLDLLEFDKTTQFHYLLSSNMDTLVWTATRTDYELINKYLRLNDQFEYYQKIKNLKIDLPHTKKKLEPLICTDFTIDLRIGYSNDGKVFCSMNYDRKLGLIMDIKGSIWNFLKEVKEDEIESVNVNMIIDKNVSQSYIDSLKSIIKFTGVNSIYRVYKNDSIDYKDNLRWYGISE